MIIKMNKYAFMVYHREYDAFLMTLRELGVVHVKETNSILDNAELQACWPNAIGWAWQSAIART